MTEARMSIGQLAKLADIHVETIRYYQRLGIIPTPTKPLYGIRRYPPTMIRQLKFIKRAQGMGFTLKEIGELLALNDASCESAQQLAEQKLLAIRERIRDLERMKVALEQSLQQCKSGSLNGCYLLEKLLGLEESA